MMPEKDPERENTYINNGVSSEEGENRTEFFASLAEVFKF
jgi:hypothetical protein